MIHTVNIQFYFRDADDPLTDEDKEEFAPEPENDSTEASTNATTTAGKGHIIHKIIYS